jgi:uncharacterized protein (TIGR02266 family)
MFHLCSHARAPTEAFSHGRRALLADGTARVKRDSCQFVIAVPFDLSGGGRHSRPMTGPVELPRAFPRLELNVYVDYTGSEVLLFHKVRNISLGGICIQSASVEDVGTMVELVLNFPDLDASLAVQGEVVWANREPPMDMGIRYVDLDNERRDTLRKYLALLHDKT